VWHCVLLIGNVAWQLAAIPAEQDVEHKFRGADFLAAQTNTGSPAILEFVQELFRTSKRASTYFWF
jgi:hypothetical protein